MSRVPKVAYFCMEYGLSADLPIYAGGLGVLAGDILKTAYDTKLPSLVLVYSGKTATLRK